MQAQARQNPSMDNGDGHEVPPLDKELWSTDNSYERKFEHS